MHAEEEEEEEHQSVPVPFETLLTVAQVLSPSAEAVAASKAALVDRDPRLDLDPLL